MFYTSDPNVQCYEAASRQARAQVVASMVAWLRQAAVSLLNRPDREQAMSHTAEPECT